MFIANLDGEIVLHASGQYVTCQFGEGEGCLPFDRVEVGKFCPALVLDKLIIGSGVKK
jgi:hypothetical protein